MMTKESLRKLRWLGQSRGARVIWRHGIAAALPRMGSRWGIAGGEDGRPMGHRLWTILAGASAGRHVFTVGQRLIGQPLPQPPRRGSLLLALVVLTQLLTGCNRSTGYERYVPAPALAEQALEQVLAAWKRGESSAPLQLASTPITIQVADATRRPGQRLVDYELLGEISGEGPRTFAVRLKLENPTIEEEVLYYLVGIDPLWVFRQEDYDAVAHWDACGREDGQAAIR
jgi:hypothetical protein